MLARCCHLRVLFFPANTSSLKRVVVRSKRTLSIAPRSQARLPSKDEVVAYDTAAVMMFATNVLGLSKVNVEVLQKLDISGPALLGLADSKMNFLMRNGMTAGAAICLNQAVEKLSTSGVRSRLFFRRTNLGVTASS